MAGKVYKTVEFLKNLFDSSKYFKKNTSEKEYRFNHTLRVANIGYKIAENEKLNADALVIGCLLHDASYANEFKLKVDWINHGRDSAEIAREFLSSLEMASDLIEEICYGIAIHVDDKAGYKGERTALACSISDCDNIDRFDVYRVYERLQNEQFNCMNLNNQLAYLTNYLGKLAKLHNMEVATETAKEMWIEKIQFQQQFFGKLKNQLKNGEKLVLCQH